MNYLLHRVGIYYKDPSWRNHMWNLLIEENMPQEAIKQKRKSGNEYFVYLKDGSSITFVNPNDHARGYRFTEAYVQPGIDLEDYRMFIQTKVSGEIYVVEDIRDFATRDNKADDYYQRLMNQEQ